MTDNTEPLPSEAAVAEVLRRCNCDALAALRQHQSAEIEVLRAENARLRGALKDSAGSLSWAARQMKGNCRGSDIDAVNLAAGRAANSAALEGGAK